MTEPRQLALVRDYDDLVEALRARAMELGATRKRIDEVAGLPDRYASKLLARGSSSRFRMLSLGRASMGPMLGALGLMLIVVEDCDTKARFASKLEIGARPYMLNGNKNAPIKLTFSRRYMKKLVRLMTEGRKRIPAWKRRQIARKAARARWKRHAEASRGVAGSAPGADGAMAGKAT